jgi:hypothetical protein
MMRTAFLASLLAVSRCSSAGRTEMADGYSGSADFCTNPPLWSDALACKLTESAATREEDKKPVEASWEGPSHCVKEYCVFANRKHSGGIVLVTTQGNVDRVAGLPDLSAGGASKPPPYAVTEVPGKGHGLVANATIKHGDRIMRRMPSVLVHRNLMQHVGREEFARMLDAAIMKLPAPRRRAYMRQVGQSGGHKLSDILFTNSFQMDVGGENGHHLGNFPEVSRFNHDCRPK